MKKTWATINETLNRSKNRTAFPSNFMINNISVEDRIPKKLQIILIDFSLMLALIYLIK